MAALSNGMSERKSITSVSMPSRANRSAASSAGTTMPIGDDRPGHGHHVDGGNSERHDVVASGRDPWRGDTDLCSK